MRRIMSSSVHIKPNTQHSPRWACGSLFSPLIVPWLLLSICVAGHRTLSGRPSDFLPSMYSGVRAPVGLIVAFAAHLRAAWLLPYRNTIDIDVEWRERGGIRRVRDWD